MTGSGATRPIESSTQRTKRELATKKWEYVQDYADAKTAVVDEIVARSDP